MNKVKDHFLLYNKEERFNHSLRVIEMALKLNQVHNLNSKLDHRLIHLIQTS